MEPAGVGDLFLAFERLKKDLEQRGWFDPNQKKPLPDTIQTVGIVTALTGAAIRDMISVIHRRDPQMAILVAPALIVAMGLGVAVLVDKLNARSEKIAKSIIFLPMAISMVGASIIWKFMYEYKPAGANQIGLFNQVIEWMGASKIAFFADETWAIPTIAFVNVWRHMGYTALLVFAGIQTIPKYVYEAAALDGSGEFSSFWRITLPLLRPVLEPKYAEGGAAA